jgi:hypothetical protein
MHRATSLCDGIRRASEATRDRASSGRIEEAAIAAEDTTGATGNAEAEEDSTGAEAVATGTGMDNTVDITADMHRNGVRN